MQSGVRDILDLYVDSTDETHRLERHPFTDRSPILRDALQQAEIGLPGSESPPELVLEDFIDEPPMPGIFALYRGYVLNPNTTVPAARNKLLSLCQLYVLAYQLGDKFTSDLVMDDILPEVRNDTIDIEHFVLAYEATYPGCPLRKLLVDCQIHVRSVMMAEHSRFVPVNGNQVYFMTFMQEVIAEYKNLTEQEVPRGVAGKDDDIFQVELADRHKCHYHHHDNNVPLCL